MILYHGTGLVRVVGQGLTDAVSTSRHIRSVYIWYIAYLIVKIKLMCKQHTIKGRRRGGGVTWLKKKV